MRTTRRRTIGVATNVVPALARKMIRYALTLGSVCGRGRPPGNRTRPARATRYG